MNAFVQEKLVEALRSGDYTQTRGALRRLDGHCCLGVLCDLHRIHTGAGEWAKMPTEFDVGDDAIVYKSNGFEQVGTPSTEVMEWAGLGVFNVSEMANRNDDGQTFAQIADYVAGLP